MVVFKVTLVGHSQLPATWPSYGEGDEAVEVRLFRSPGGTFRRNRVLREVLEWPHDLTVLWLGPNDICNRARPIVLANDIRELVREIENRCGSKVLIALSEPRTGHRRSGGLEPGGYNRVAFSANRRFRRSLRDHVFLDFTAPPYQRELGQDGVHFTAVGRETIQQKIRRMINREHEAFLISHRVPGPRRP